MARPGARRHESGPRQPAFMLKNGAGGPVDFVAGSYDNSPRKRCGPGPRWRCHRHALPYYTGLTDILPLAAGLASSDAFLFLQSGQPRSGFSPSPHRGRRAVVDLNGWPKAVPCGVSRVWVGLSRLGAEPLLRRRWVLNS